MNVRKRSAPRQEEVLKLLATHNAISYGTLRTLLNSDISRRRVRAILSNLEKEGRISRRTIHMYGGRAYFFELPTAVRNALDIPRIYWATLPHNDLCTLVHVEFQKLFPNARLWREHEISRNQVLRQVMAYEHGATDSLPDILMRYPSTGTAQPVYVAIEIERMAKSTKRLLQKFSKYAIRTKLDGVIYLSEDQSLMEKLRNFYCARITQSARRIAHYPMNYFLTGDCSNKRNLTVTNLQNAAGESVSLLGWIQNISGTPMVQRRDKHFVNYSPMGTLE